MEIINKKKLKKLLSITDSVKINNGNEGICFKSDVIESFISIIELSVNKEPIMTRSGYYPSMQFYKEKNKILSINFNTGSNCIQIYNFNNQSGLVSLLGVVQNKKELNNWFQTLKINWR